MADKETLNPNEVKLSDGRVVVLKETTGLDEIVATQMLGNKLTSDLSGTLLLQKAIIMRGIESIDGTPFKKTGLKFKDLQDFYAGLSTKDSARLTKKYSELNSDKEEVGNDLEPESEL